MRLIMLASCIDASLSLTAQGVKLRLIQAPMRLNFSLSIGNQILKISRQIGD